MFKLVLLAVFIISVEGLFFPPAPQQCCCQPPPPPPPPPCPPPPPPPPCGCGRKKREAVQPYNKNEEIPCPQTQWKTIIDAHLSEDTKLSAEAIQLTMFKRYGNKFFVQCEKSANKKVPFLANGDGYCVSSNDQIRCTVVSISS